MEYEAETFLLSLPWFWNDITTKGHSKSFSHEVVERIQGASKDG
jgi:hypothetical protein